MIKCKEITNSVFQMLLKALNKIAGQGNNNEKVHAVSGLNTNHI